MTDKEYDVFFKVLDFEIKQIEERIEILNCCCDESICLESDDFIRTLIMQIEAFRIAMNAMKYIRIYVSSVRAFR